MPVRVDNCIIANEYCPPTNGGLLPSVAVNVRLAVPPLLPLAMPFPGTPGATGGVTRGKDGAACVSRACMLT